MTVIKPSDRETLVALLKALADPTRLQILETIARSPEQETCVDELKPQFAMSQPAISQHLKVLLDAGLVMRDKRGSWHWYRINPAALRALRVHAHTFLHTTSHLDEE